MEEKNSNVTKWLQANFEQKDNRYIPREIVFQYYLHMCKRDGIKALPLSSFDRVLKQIFPDVTVSTPGTKKTRMYLNLHVRQNDEEQKRKQLQLQTQRKRQKLEATYNSDADDEETLSNSAMRFLSDLLNRERRRATEDFLAGARLPNTSNSSGTSNGNNRSVSSPPLYGPLPTEWLGGFVRWDGEEGRESDDEGIMPSDADSPTSLLGHTNHLLDLMLNQELFS